MIFYSPIFTSWFIRMHQVRLTEESRWEVGNGGCGISKVNDYTLNEVLGRGTSGVVHRVTCPGSADDETSI